MNTITRVLAAVAATAATVLTLTAAPATAAPSAEPLTFNVKTFCKADGTTRVRVHVDNNAGRFQALSYAVTYSDGRRKQYTTLLDKRPLRQSLVAATVPAAGTVTITVGPRDSDTFDGTWAGTFSPIAC